MKLTLRFLKWLALYGVGFGFKTGVQVALCPVGYENFLKAQVRGSFGFLRCVLPITRLNHGWTPQNAGNWEPRQSSNNDCHPNGSEYRYMVHI